MQEDLLLFGLPVVLLFLNPFLNAVTRRPFQIGFNFAVLLYYFDETIHSTSMVFPFLAFLISILLTLLTTAFFHYTPTEKVVTKTNSEIKKEVMEHIAETTQPKPNQDNERIRKGLEERRRWRDAGR